jgi:hypothetical protein
MESILSMMKDDNPMPAKHQFLQLMLATAIGFVVHKLVEKSYLKIWSRKGR